MAIVGSGIGAAMQGMRPVVEIMYEDFLTLSMEQLVNQAAKHRTMSGGQLKVPLTIRTQGGAGWSPGAQHAQQLEAWFVHVPGLKVVFASTPEDVRGLLWSSIYDDNPVVFFEHRHALPDQGRGAGGARADPARQGARSTARATDVTVVATGRLVHEALKAAEEAEQDGISVEVVDPRTLLPLDEETIVGSVRKTTRCVTAHEAVTRGGFGAELAAVIQHGAFDWLDAPIERVGREVRAAPVRAGDGAVGRPARRRRARRDPADGGAGVGDGDEVKLPRLGQGMESGTIVRWLKGEGDVVAKGEPLYELDTDKVTQEVEAEADGRRCSRSSSPTARWRSARPSPSSARRTRTCPRSSKPRASGNGGAPRAEAAPSRGRASRLRRPETRDEPKRRGGRSGTGAAAPRRAREGEPARAADRARARDSTSRRSPAPGPEGRIIAEDVERAGAAPAAAPRSRRAAPARSRSSSSRRRARRSRAA